MSRTKKIKLNRCKTQKSKKSNCNKIAIITVFRDNGGQRERERQIFIEAMKLTNFHIFIIEQNEKDDFNNGKLKNIGFEIAKKFHFNHYIFSDIDILPDCDICLLYTSDAADE